MAPLKTPLSHGREGLLCSPTSYSFLWGRAKRASTALSAVAFKGLQNKQAAFRLRPRVGRSGKREIEPVPCNATGSLVEEPGKSGDTQNLTGKVLSSS